MASLKEIKTRIASVKNTLKITSSMKLVASAKLHKAQMAIETMMPYNERLNAMVNHLIQVASLSTEKAPSSTYQLVNSSTELNRVAIVTISSNASLCGGFNNNIIRFTQGIINEYEEKLGQGSILLIPIGRKVAQALPVNPSTESSSLITDFIDLAEHPTYAQASALSSYLTDLYLRGKIDRVEILYTHYKNMAVQVLTRNQFLPLEDKIQDSKFNVQGSMERVGLRHPELDSGSEDSNSQMLNQVLHNKMVEGEKNKSASSASSASEKLADGQRGGSLEYILEPSLPELLANLLPQALASSMYALLLDSQAAEHAARTFAMQTATDNGDALLQELNLQFNKVRQQSITNELLDIVGGQMR